MSPALALCLLAPQGQASKVGFWARLPEPYLLRRLLALFKCSLRGCHGCYEPLPPPGKEGTAGRPSKDTSAEDQVESMRCLRHQFPMPMEGMLPLCWCYHTWALDLTTLKLNSMIERFF